MVNTMKRNVIARLLSISLSSMLVLLLAVKVSAHSGRTDSSGGHTNRATGEYHYHHGYPAHDHYDMDGDGIVDCPYLFDDQTNHSSSTSSSPKTETTPTREPETEPTQKQTVPTETVAKPEPAEEKSPFPLKNIMLIVLSVMILVLLAKVKFRNDELERLKKDHEACIDKLTKEHEACINNLTTGHKSEIEKKEAEICSLRDAIRKDNIQHEAEKKMILEKTRSAIAASRRDLHNQLTALDATFRGSFGINYLSALLRIPHGDFVGGDGLPSCNDGTADKWGEKYTFYISAYRGTKYHKRKCSSDSNQNFVPKNAYTIFQSNSIYEPCKKCNPILPDLTWYIRCKQVKDFREKYM